MAASFDDPKVTNPILDDVGAIQQLFGYLAKADPSLGANYPVDSIKLKHDKSNNSWVIQFYNGTSWKDLGRLNMDVYSLQGYTPSTSAVAGTIPVYNAQGALVGNVSGNAPTATKLQTPRSMQVGGILSSTAQNFDGSVNITIPVNQITINNVNDTAINGTLTTLHGGTGRTDGAAQDVRVSSVSGEIGAKSVGQIGDAINKGAVDADTLVATGNYIVKTNENTFQNHWPQIGYNNQVIRVSRQGTVIFQFLKASTYEWARTSTDSGASWSAWYPRRIQTSSGNQAIFISKSGSDSNTGLNSSYPVLTFARAKEIAETIYSNGNHRFNVRFCFGAGNWGTIYIDQRNYWAEIWPYDQGVPTAYSTSLPVFDAISIQGTHLTFVGCVCGSLNAYYDSFLWVNKGYKRLGALVAGYKSMIVCESQNAASNLIDWVNTNSTSYRGVVIENHSSYYSNYIRWRFPENINYENSSFFHVGNGGYAFLSSNFVLDTSLSGTLNAHKYYIHAGASVISGVTAKNLSILDGLPGTLPGITFDGSIVNGMSLGAAIQDDIVTIASAQTITGTKIFSNGTGDTSLKIKKQTVLVGTAPATTQYCYTEFLGGDNRRLGYVGVQKNTDGTSSLNMEVNGQNGGLSLFKIERSIDNVNRAYFPTPPAADNTNSGATTVWVRSRLSEGIANFVNKQANYSNGTLDPNTALDATMLCSDENCGLTGYGANWFYIFQVFYGGVAATNARMQLAVGYNINLLFIRHYYNNAWSTWTRMADTTDSFKPGDVLFTLVRSARAGFLYCNGAAVSRTTYANLFKICSTNYGNGDGSTTFNLPNFQQKWMRIGDAAWAPNTMAVEDQPGLPEIKGRIRFAANVVHAYNEAFTSYTGSNGGGATVTGSVPGMGIEFRASGSNSVYGQSAEVRPHSIRLHAWIKY